MKKEDRKEQFTNDTKWLFKKKISNKGKYDNKSIYENTIASYKKSLEDKTPFKVEVQLTNDYQVICFSDDTLKRLFNRDRVVGDISYKRINKLRDELQVPLLKDVLKLVDGKVELVVELKSTNHKFNKTLVKNVYEVLKDYNGKYVVVSFNPFMLASYRRMDKNVYIGRMTTTNTTGVVEKLINDKLCFNFISKADFYMFDVENYDEKKLTKYKEKGYKVIGWTLKDSDSEKDLKKNYDNFVVEGDI